MKRRDFFGLVGAAALVPLIPGGVTSVPEPGKNSHEICTARFDYNTAWGVAIRTSDGRRNAVRLAGDMSRDEAIHKALPMLAAWAGERVRYQGKVYS